MKLWKKILLIVVAAIILVPTGAYVTSLDWDRAHRAYVSGLPLFEPGVADGEYQITAGDFTYRARVAGLNNVGPNILLLHGFPESSVIWEELIAAASGEGFRVVAFDQRGYSPGARPSGAENYELPLLINDVYAVADAVGFDTFHLAGHDWGAVVGWFTVMNNDYGRINSWAALSIPHSGVFFKGTIDDPVQAERSGYVKFLQRPFLPEFLFTMRAQKSLKDMFARVPARNRDEYIRIQSEPGALTAALNWYRAVDVPAIAEGAAFQKAVALPTLFIWGKNDFVISESVIATARNLMPEDYTEIALDAGHALLQHAPDQVLPALIAHWHRQSSPE